MITFQCFQETISWRVERNERLVCFYSSFERAMSAVESFVGNCQGSGKSAQVLPPRYIPPCPLVGRPPTIPVREEAGFAEEILALKPRLMRTAMYLTKRPYYAAALVQDTVARALLNSEKFERGPHLAAWLNKMMRNLFYTDCRSRAREIVTGHVDDAQDFIANNIPAGQREALCLVSNGTSYSEVAEQIGYEEGTVKSRGKPRAFCVAARIWPALGEIED
jgi:DNA-directed RNA polymerase specialized sigma24 family protein